MIGHYPTVIGELERRDSPVFYHKDKIAVAVKQAGGCSKIAIQTSLLMEVIDQNDQYENFGGFLLFCDTDTGNAANIKKRLADELFYADKVQFGAISSVLKPDKPIRFSIKDKLIRTKYKDLYGFVYFSGKNN